MPGILPMKRIKGPFGEAQRTAQACDRCRVKKIKCDGKDPCTACRDVRWECTTTDQLTRSGWPKGYTALMEELVPELQGENRKLKQKVSGLEQSLKEAYEKIDLLLCRQRSFDIGQLPSPPLRSPSPSPAVRPSTTSSESSGVDVKTEGSSDRDEASSTRQPPPFRFLSDGKMAYFTGMPAVDGTVAVARQGPPAVHESTTSAFPGAMTTTAVVETHPAHPQFGTSAPNLGIMSMASSRLLANGTSINNNYMYHQVNNAVRGSFETTGETTTRYSGENPYNIAYTYPSVEPVNNGSRETLETTAGSTDPSSGEVNLNFLDLDAHRFFNL